MVRYVGRIAPFVLLASFFIGCATVKDAPLVEGPKPNPLLVGVTPDSPPMIFRLNGEISGAEADMARRLAKELGRPLEFVDLGWEQEIPALLEGKTDIIMSGMTITDARKVRINFTYPYLKSGLVIAMRAGDASKYTSVKSILDDFPTTGVIKGTTGEAYVRKNFPPAIRIVAVPNIKDAVLELRQRRIDIIVHDAPAIVWIVSENEAEIKGLWEPLNEEDLGWGVRRDDEEFLDRVNTVLRNWKKDGTLKEILLKWLPYWKNFD
ncbi:MAG TPA: transporter substrate-binding domain-containing protein [Thermodesulfovibrionales bacterium]|nr:transporter substrate-binding domain-containing protein [Thermodesulfovibrionales bacterium]